MKIIIKFMLLLSRIAGIARHATTVPTLGLYFIEVFLDPIIASNFL
jgi:hypothetical protein